MFEHMTIRQKVKATVVIIGLLVFSGALPSFPFAWIWTVLAFTALIVIAEFLDVTLPQGSHISVSSAFIVAMLYIMPMQPAIAAAGFGLMLATLLRERHLVWEEMFFSPAKNMLALFCASLAYQFLKTTGAFDQVWSYGMIALALAGTVYYAVDTILDQVNLPYGTGRYFLRSYVSSWRLAGTTYLALCCSGLLIALTFSQVGYWGILLLLLPLFVIRYCFRLYINIKRTYQNTIEALASAIETQDPRRRGHAKRVAEYSIAIARELGIYGDDLETLGYGALLHDIGKIGKDEEERYEMFEAAIADRDQHSQVGADIIKNIKYLPNVAKIIAGHHKVYSTIEEESLDANLFLGASIVSVASTYDNLVNMPILGERIDSKSAIKVIKREQNTTYDPVVVRALAEVLRKTGQLSFRF